jgi:hypothetical protein
MERRDCRERRERREIEELSWSAVNLGKVTSPLIQFLSFFHGALTVRPHPNLRCACSLQAMLCARRAAGRVSPEARPDNQARAEVPPASAGPSRLKQLPILGVAMAPFCLFASVAGLQFRLLPASPPRQRGMYPRCGSLRPENAYPLVVGPRGHALSPRLPVLY